MRGWATEHRADLVPFLAACIEAQRWLMNPANKERVLEMLTGQSKLAPEVAAATYEALMTRPGGYEKDAELDGKGFSNVLKLRAEVEGQWNGRPPGVEKYYDSSYYQAALQMAKGEK